MNEKSTLIKTALLSVSDKSGLIELAQELHLLGIKLISTGGTAKTLTEAKIPHQLVSDLTGFPEIMSGRVKTLHPKIHAGILGQRDQHATEATTHHIEWIDLVVCNLYPFAETIKKSPDFDTAIENIDVGGPTMIRAAAKNMDWVTVVTDPEDYNGLICELKESHGVSFTVRKRFAAKAFGYTAQYDIFIQNYLEERKFPEVLNLSYVLEEGLRYGENPHQEACLYRRANVNAGLLNAIQIQGKPMSFNNYVDSEGAIRCLSEFQEPACVVVKHANPCGAAVGDNIDYAFRDAFEADSQSAFGGIVALNRACSKSIAEYLSQVFFEIIIAPDYSNEALAIFSTKKNIRVLKLSEISAIKPKNIFKPITGGLLVQDNDLHELNIHQLNTVTTKAPTEKQLADLLFAWRVVKHIKSNAILIAKNLTTVGVGAGQVSRIDAVDIAIRKSGIHIKDSVLASDAFFPFRDSIDEIAKTGVTAIIQPGGSIRDKEVIQACDEHGIAMIFTGTRCFNH